MIRFRSANRGSWLVTYQFDSSDNQMQGPETLEGKYTNVRWDGGRPVSLKSPYGSGHNVVVSARRE